MATKLIQLSGLLIVAVATVVFVGTLVLHDGELATGDFSRRESVTALVSFLAGIAGISVFMFGRLLSWWD